MNPDKAATVGGVVLAAIVAANVDWAEVVAGNKGEVSKVVGAGIVALLGWLMNKGAGAGNTTDVKSGKG